MTAPAQAPAFWRLSDAARQFLTIAECAAGLGDADEALRVILQGSADFKRRLIGAEALARKEERVLEEERQPIEVTAGEVTVRAFLYGGDEVIISSKPKAKGQRLVWDQGRFDHASGRLTDLHFGRLFAQDIYEAVEGALRARTAGRAA